MPLKKTEAVVLKTQKLGETSKLITLYTKEYGKIKIIAKGARGFRSKFFGTLEPLTYISIVYYHKESRELQILSQSDINRAYDGIRKDLMKYALATFFCDMINHTQMEQPNDHLFRLLTVSLEGLDSAKNNLMNFYVWFILQFIRINGLDLHLSKCQNCSSTTVDRDVHFSLINGNYSCPNCRFPESMTISVSGKTIEYLRLLRNTPIPNLETISGFDSLESEKILLTFLQYHIEEAKNLKSIKFLKQIQNNSI